ncbi:hypothetical protein PIB30_010191 [Stylosanthes scabra]|uniref:Uncharacterized protein n=1 Tax=Stylosanthes scabra TaxID=79078 RepID=A0ABU6R4C3_9FABA|nr:hypothetical protein [Stylosanthes scabra]
MDLNGYKKSGVVFPSFIRCKFKIEERYKYSQEQAQAIAYIFGDKKDSHEVLFKRGSRQMDREDFGVLLPGNEPSDYVMEMMAFKTAWTQYQLQEISIWFLPVYFSDYVLRGDVSQEEVFSMFKDEWLPKPKGLRYATALDHIIRIGFLQVNVLGQRPPLQDWGPEFVLGIPNMGNSMDTAMDLVMDFVNELKGEVTTLARKYWDDRRSIPYAAPPN